jgi:hypothetical protein
LAEIYIKVWFEGNSLAQMGVGRSLFEDALDEALSDSGLGEVIGGGGGVLGSDIAIEITEGHNVEPALTLIQAVLRENNAPTNTTIKIRDTDDGVYYV